MPTMLMGLILAGSGMLILNKSLRWIFQKLTLAVFVILKSLVVYE